MRHHIYLPAPGHRLPIDPGAGIVGTPAESQVIVDMESGRLGQANLVTWADRIHHAAGRHSARYPTTARLNVPADTVVRVGTYDDSTGQVHIDVEHRDLVADWLGADDVDDGELATTSVTAHRKLADLRQWLADHPEDQAQKGMLARWMGVDEDLL